jgi:hypothetical protein
MKQKYESVDASQATPMKKFLRGLQDRVSFPKFASERATFGKKKIDTSLDRIRSESHEEKEK